MPDELDPPHIPGLLHELLDHAAARWPDRAAVTVAGNTLDYRELDAASRRLAVRLHSSGLRRGRRLLIRTAAAPVLPALLHAASRLGVVFCVLHEHVRGTPLRHVLADCEPALFVSDEEEALDEAAALGVATAALKQLDHDAFDPSGPLEQPLPRQPLGVDPVCLIYTSGTTSLPKAVVSTHGQLLFSVGAIQSRLGYRPDDKVFSPLPFSFDYGLYQLFLTTAAGAHLHVAGAAETGLRLVDALRSTGATVLPAVPSLVATLAALAARNSNPPSRLRLLTTTGAAMPPGLADTLRGTLPGVSVQIMFGLTECKRATIMPPDGDVERPGSSGTALPGTEILIIDEEGRPQPAGTAGQIVVRGPNVMAGYWRRPQETPERFHHDQGLFPQLRTGDYGHLDEDGYLYVEGRRDDLYKENGFRVSTTEVEAAALRITGVTAAAVLAPTADRHAHLFVVSEMSANQVLARLRDQIETYKIPQHCSVLPHLPLTAHGKVDRRALARAAVTGTADEPSETPQDRTKTRPAPHELPSP